MNPELGIVILAPLLVWLIVFTASTLAEFRLQQQFQRDIARCDREIAAMEQQPPTERAYLTTMGIQDWKRERRILQELTGDKEGLL